jgi:hypothetical protein
MRNDVGIIWHKWHCVNLSSTTVLNTEKESEIRGTLLSSCVYQPIDQVPSKGRSRKWQIIRYKQGNANVFRLRNWSGVLTERLRPSCSLRRKRAERRQGRSGQSPSSNDALSAPTTGLSKIGRRQDGPSLQRNRETDHRIQYGRSQFSPRQPAEVFIYVKAVILGVGAVIQRKLSESLSD